MSKQVEVKILRGMYVGGEKIKVGSKAFLPRVIAERSAFAGKVEILKSTVAAPKVVTEKESGIELGEEVDPETLEEGDIVNVEIDEDGDLDLDDLSHKELKEIAKKEGVDHHHALGKEKLADLLEEHFNSQES